MAVSIFYTAYCRIYQGILRVATRFLNWEEPKLIKGAGSVKRLPEIIKADGHKNVLIVTDKGLTSIGLLDGLLEGLKKEGIKYSLYDGTQPNPTVENVERARELYVKNGCSAVVAFGGGSPMDCAKLAAARIARPDKTVSQTRGILKIRKKLPAIYAVPTTAGTGSETTIVAVASDPGTREKYAVTDPVLRPKYATLDPELLLGLPAEITATTGMDALTHAVEAYIGRCNTKETKAAAEKATRLIFDNILKVYKNGRDAEAREKTLEASYLAGIAFTRAYVGYVHAIAHALGGLYGTPHGLANAVILPYVLERYGESAHKSLAKLSDAAGFETAGLSEEAKAKLFIEKVKELKRLLNIPERLDILEKDADIIARRAAKEGNPFYPVPKIMGFDDLKSIISEFGNFK